MSSFSALQRAEIAEIPLLPLPAAMICRVSVLFNEPKLLKLVVVVVGRPGGRPGFSALQRAEIAEMTSRH